MTRGSLVAPLAGGGFGQPRGPWTSLPTRTRIKVSKLDLLVIGPGAATAGVVALLVHNSFLTISSSPVKGASPGAAQRGVGLLLCPQGREKFL